MAISLSKAAETRRGVSHSLPDLDGYRSSFEARVFDGYCSSSHFDTLLEEAALGFRLDKDIAKASINIELERMSIANEYLLVQEMQAMLRQFTEKDKKLDSKERADIVQLFCKPKSGYSKGLDINVAGESIVDFCRKNGVKVKVGFLKWAIP